MPKQLRTPVGRAGPTTLLVLLGFLFGGGVAAAQVNRRHSETRLGAFPAEVRDTAVISSDCTKVAYIATSGAEKRVVVNGAAQEAFDRIVALAFSDDSQRLAYAAETAGHWYIVADGKPWGPHDRVGRPVFAPSGSHLAYVALLPDDRRTVLVDGRAGASYDAIFDGAVVWSADGEHLAYGARRGESWYVVLDGEEHGPYDYLGSATGIRFSADGAFAAFSVLEDEAWSMVVLAVPGEAGATAPRVEEAVYQNMGQAAFAPVGRGLAYMAMADGRWFVVRDGHREPAFDAIAENSLLYSPDGRRLAYAARSGERWRLVLDGQSGEAATATADMEFGPDGRSFAYVHEEPSGECVVLDGLKQTIYDSVGGGSLVFSQSGGRFGYLARTGWARFAVIDGVRRRRYQNVGYLTFSPDGGAAAYVAVDAEKAFTVVEDEPSAHAYDEIWMPPGGRLLFTYRDTFRYLGVRDDAIYMVEEKL